MQVETIQPRFSIDKCSLINQWAWRTLNDCCPICRNSINEESIVTENDPDNSSHIVIGMCGHAFHYECINKWITTSSNVCPLCNASWNYKKTFDVKDTSNNIQEEFKENITNLLPNLPQGYSVTSTNNISNDLEEQIVNDSEDDPDMPELIDDNGNVV